MVVEKVMTMVCDDDEVQVSILRCSPLKPIISEGQ